MSGNLWLFLDRTSLLKINYNESMHWRPFLELTNCFYQKTLDSLICCQLYINNFIIVLQKVLALCNQNFFPNVKKKVFLQVLAVLIISLKGISKVINTLTFCNQFFSKMSNKLIKANYLAIEFGYYSLQNLPLKLLEKCIFWVLCYKID